MYALNSAAPGTGITFTDPRSAKTYRPSFPAVRPVPAPTPNNVPTAIVDPRAELASTVTVAAYAVIGAPEVAPAPASVTAPKAFVAQVIPEPIQLPPDLVLIETRHAAPVASAPDPEQPRRGRPRPQVVIPVEAGFQQVETRDK